MLVVALRELRDLVRDRRAVFVALACALGLPPLLAIMGQVLFVVAARNYAVARRAEQTPAPVAPLATATVWVRGLSELPPGCVAQLYTAGLAVAELPADVDPRAALERGRVQVVVEPPSRAELGMADVAHVATFALLYDSRSSLSERARWTVRDALVRWRQELLDERLRERGLGRPFLTPLGVAATDVRPPAPAATQATPADQRAQLALIEVLGTWQGTLQQSVARTRLFLGAAAAFVLCCTGLLICVPSAINMGVLERERGTLEALLLTPAPRATIALGKTLALSISTLGLSALMALSSALTMSPVALQARASEDPTLREFFAVFELSPLGLLGALLALAPFTVFCSAGALALAATIKSEREGSYLLGPILIVALLLMAVGCLPPGEGLPLSDAAMALIPFAGMTALVRALLVGSAGWSMLASALLSTLLCALLAVRYVARVYEREDAVLRAAAAPGFGVFERRNAPDAQGRVLPTPAQGLFLALLVLVLEWIVGGSLAALGAQRGLVATGGLVLFALPLAYAVALGLDLAPSFGLTRAAPQAMLAGALLGMATPVLALDVFALQTRLTGRLLPEEAALYERLLRELTAGGGVQALLLLAVLPGVLEELLFRGFLLGGLRRWGAARAVAVSALFFALVHLDPARFGVTGLLGVLLALLTLGAGSVLPAIAAHTCHNGLAGLGGLAWLEALGLVAEGRPGWTLRGPALGLVVGALLLARRRRMHLPPGLQLS